jgi:hypothetical protein
MAALVAGVSVIGLSITKSCIVPEYWTPVTLTPASLSLCAYASHSSRRTSNSPFITNAGGKSFNCSIDA